jgi:hypothetical protein
MIQKKVRQIVGNYRPEWNELLEKINKEQIHICICGSILSSLTEIHSHWYVAHFDTPIYSTLVINVEEEKPNV